MHSLSPILVMILFDGMFVILQNEIKNIKNTLLCHTNITITTTVTLITIITPMP